jgi:PAS domain S-box-containing protein
MKSVSAEKPAKTSRTAKWLSFIPGVFLISVIGFTFVFVLNLLRISNIITGVIITLIFVLFIIHQYLVISENNRLNREMSLINAELEQKVLRRTEQLNSANDELRQEMTVRRKTEEILKQSEEKYRLIAENTGDVIWVMNVGSLKFTFISPSVFNLTGFSVDETMNQKISELLTPESYDFFAKSLAIRISKFYIGDKSTTTNIDEFRVICKNNSVIWVEISTTLIINSEGKITDIIGVSRNIEQRKKAEQQIQEKNKELSGINATKDKFFSIIAHDLKNPLISVIGLSNLLDSKINTYSNEKIKVFSTAINDASKSAYKLLENLLDWSRLQRDKITPYFQEYNFIMIAEDVIRLNNEAAIDKNITLRNNIAANVNITCDVEITKTILRNLVSNAVKFTNKGGTIDVDLSVSESLSEIRVSDTGVGISPEKIPFLFVIDHDISTLGTSNEKGTGLGLILCKELVGKQGGSIWVESTLGKGSTFCFTIPRIEK